MQWLPMNPDPPVTRIVLIAASRSSSSRSLPRPYQSFPLLEKDSNALPSREPIAGLIVMYDDRGSAPWVLAESLAPGCWTARL